MAGKAGRSGRPKGFSPIGLAGHHLNVLIELWLAGYPIGRGMPALAEIAFGQAKAANPNLKWPPLDQETIKKVIDWTKRQAPDVTLRRQRQKTIILAQEQELRAKRREDLTDSELRQLRAAAWRDLLARSGDNSAVEPKRKSVRLTTKK